MERECPEKNTQRKDFEKNTRIGSIFKTLPENKTRAYNRRRGACLVVSRKADVMELKDELKNIIKKYYEGNKNEAFTEATDLISKFLKVFEDSDRRTKELGTTIGSLNEENLYQKEELEKLQKAYDDLEKEHQEALDNTTHSFEELIIQADKHPTDNLKLQDECEEFLERRGFTVKKER